MQAELGPHVYEPTERDHPAVASTPAPLSVLPSLRRSNISRSRSASNPARSIDTYASHFPSGENRGVLSAPGLAVMGRRLPPVSTVKRSTFVLSATVVSPCIATTIWRPSGETATSPSPPVAIVGTS